MVGAEHQLSRIDSSKENLPPLLYSYIVSPGFEGAVTRTLGEHAWSSYHIGIPQSQPSGSRSLGPAKDHRPGAVVHTVLAERQADVRENDQLRSARLADRRARLPLRTAPSRYGQTVAANAGFPACRLA